jgi:hypothetical protein
LKLIYPCDTPLSLLIFKLSFPDPGEEIVKMLKYALNITLYHGKWNNTKFVRFFRYFGTSVIYNMVKADYTISKKKMIPFPIREDKSANDQIK